MNLRCEDQNLYNSTSFSKAIQIMDLIVLI